MNLVVTGATSFLGAPMVEYCLKQGHQVFAVVRPGSKNMAQIRSAEKTLWQPDSGCAYEAG